MPKATKPKIRENQVLHPYSRKAAQLARRDHHTARVDKRKKEASIKMGVQGEKVVWFRDNLEENKMQLNKGEVLTLIERYLGRYEEELEQINLTNSIKGRKGRQHASREDNIKITIEKERREFDFSGLEIPDLFAAENVAYLRNWSGELRYLANIKMTTVKREHLN